MEPSSDEKINVDHQDLSAEQAPPLVGEERLRREKALVRKLDCFIAPVMMILMLISYLDRGNIGFGATQGMPDELGLKGSDLNFPAMTLLLCNWYKREELAVRVAYLFIASALSGAFGGLLAWAMLDMNGVRGLSGWRCGGSGHYSRNDISEAARDVKSWLQGFTQIAVVTILYGFGAFLPIIIKDGFHYSTVQAQYLVIPVNLWGGPRGRKEQLLDDGYRSQSDAYYTDREPDFKYQI
ncbi:hypothetical protein PG994_009033 [Apiospora phragmitis]|uniref:Uncharacterized protein n=1 Tax=Apiospora phragmitis TaxID=2905665 RepID=A0ABR1UI54_9PEZI